MNERTIYILAALIGGTFIPVQVAVNTLLRRYIGEPMRYLYLLFSWHINRVAGLCDRAVSIARSQCDRSIFLVDVDRWLFGYVVCVVNYCRNLKNRRNIDSGLNLCRTDVDGTNLRSLRRDRAGKISC
jgi:hypothetical protein